MKPLLTKKELKSKLLATATMDELFDLTTGMKGVRFLKLRVSPQTKTGMTKSFTSPTWS